MMPEVTFITKAKDIEGYISDIYLALTTWCNLGFGNFF